MNPARAVYLHGDAAAPLQVVARGQGNGGGDGRWRAGLQAVAGTDELRQGLQGVYAQLDELTLEREWAQGSAGRLQGGIKSDHGGRRQRLKGVTVSNEIQSGIGGFNPIAISDAARSASIQNTAA